MRRAGFILLMALLLLPLVAGTGCGGKGSGGDRSGKATRTSSRNDNSQSTRRLDGGFDFEVFKQVAEEDKKGDTYGNVFISPESLRIALMMAYNGSQGETRKAMAQALGVQDLSLEEANGASAAVLKVLQEAGEGALVEVANSLWGRDDVTFDEDFIARNREFYDAEVREIDTPGEINRWVNEKTHGKIDEIVDQIDPGVVLFLINALYFKGEWSVKFDEALTKEKDFTLQDGSKKRTPLMQGSGEYEYLENGQFQAVELPYGDEGKMSMYVFLPRQGLGLQNFVQALGSDNWSKWMSEFSSREGDIYIPKFKLEYEKELNPSLISLGMGIAFDGRQADFAEMISEESKKPMDNVYMSKVLQKTFVEVNEEGTEAAAVTDVEMVEATAPPHPEDRFEMMVDRPFFFAIRNNESDALLFTGLVADPVQ